jgi:hypothetical protein
MAREPGVDSCQGKGILCLSEMVPSAPCSTTALQVVKQPELLTHCCLPQSNVCICLHFPCAPLCCVPYTHKCLTRRIRGGMQFKPTPCKYRHCLTLTANGFYWLPSEHFLHLHKTCYWEQSSALPTGGNETGTTAHL